jgi:hypothetical protein
MRTSSARREINALHIGKLVAHAVVRKRRRKKMNRSILKNAISGLAAIIFGVALSTTAFAQVEQPSQIMLENVLSF